MDVEARILERQPELDAISSALADVAGGIGTSVLLEAPAGAGKTTLMDWAADRARGLGLAVLRAAASPLDAGVAYAVARQLLDRPLAGLDPAQRATVLGGLAAPAAAVLGLDALGATATRVDDPHEAVHALFWLTVQLADRQPLVLLVDDLHWADAGSARYLEYLARRLGDLPVGLVVAARPTAPDDASPERRAVRGLARVALAPPPLSTGAVGQLVEAAFGEGDDAFAAACEAATGGNPLLVTALLGALRRDGVRPSAGAPALERRPTPDAVRRSLDATLTTAGPAGRRIALAVAVLGACPLDDAIGLAAVERADAVAAIDGLHHAGLLAGGPELRFAHPLFSQACLESTGPSERSAWHERAAALLHARGDTVGAVASHLLLTQPAGRREVVAQLRAAAEDALARGNPEAAAAHLRRALAEPPAPDDRPELALRAGVALRRAHRWADAADVLAAGLRTVPPDDPARVRLTEALGRVEFYAGRYEAALRHTQDAAALAVEPRDRDAAEARLLALGLLHPDHRAVVAGTLAAAREAWRSGLPDHEPQQLMAAAAACLFGEDAAAARPLLTTALRDQRLLSGDDQEFITGWVVPAADAADATHEALAFAQEREADARRRGDDGTLNYLLIIEAWLLYRLGRLTQAYAFACEASERAAREDFAQPVCMVDLLIERDEPAAALARADALVAPEPSPQLAAMTQLVRGRALWATGRPDEALEHLEAAGRTLDQLEMRNPSFAPWRALAVQAAVAAGREDRAREHAEVVEALAARVGTGSARVQALRCRAAVADDDAAAVVALHDAVALAATLPYRCDEAAARLELGARLAHVGRGAAAQDALRQALDVAHGIGALRIARLAREALVATGARPRRAALTGVESLTPSELQVARLAASGLKNREIAAELFVTLKTVEQHLNRTYAKLGIQGRPGLAPVLAPDRAAGGASSEPALK